MNAVKLTKAQRYWKKHVIAGMQSGNGVRTHQVLGLVRKMCTDTVVSSIPFSCGLLGNTMVAGVTMKIGLVACLSL